MREILFRGKSVDTGKWIKGHYVQKPNPCSEDGEPRIHFIMDVPPFGAAVYPETVGQYTGLTDKNSKKIFEGDIVRHHNVTTDVESTWIFDVGMIFWDNEYQGYRRTSNEVFNGGAVKTYRLSASCLYEVIGNIHDNPELLQEGK